MKMKHLGSALLILSLLAFAATGCKKKPKDADLKAAIEKVVGTGVTVDVTNGAVTLSGSVPDDAAKAAAETAAKTVEGIGAVTNNISVTPPPPPVVINPDQVLTDAVNTVLKAYSGVTADIKDGVVTLNGNIKKADLRTLMTALNGLKPKKIENKLTIK
jgi:osmotically-inducible protein OsmY